MLQLGELLALRCAPRDRALPRRQPVRDDHHGLAPVCPVQPARDGSFDLSLWRAGRNGAIFSTSSALTPTEEALARR